MDRTLEAWKAFTGRTGKQNITDYFIYSDILTADVISYIRAHMPLETDKSNFVQVNDIQGYCYDLAKALRPVFPTFAECGGQWRYYRVYYKWETINRF